MSESSAEWIVCYQSNKHGHELDRMLISLSSGIGIDYIKAVSPNACLIQWSSSHSSYIAASFDAMHLAFAGHPCEVAPAGKPKKKGLLGRWFASADHTIE